MSNPSIIDFSILSAIAYNLIRSNENQIELPLGWVPIFPLSDPNGPSGFSASAFQNGNNIVISFEGTDTDNYLNAASSLI